MSARIFPDAKEMKVPVPGLTPKRIRNIKPKKYAYYIRHHNPKGLNLKVAPSGRKTFVVSITRKGVRHIETLGYNLIDGIA